MKTPIAERRITKTEQQILDILHGTGPKGIHTDRIWHALYAHLPECDQPESRIIPVLVCNLRKKIKARGLDIQPIRSFGYRLVQVTHAQQI
jgi:DNA-binding response OmpR family regulator